MKKDIISDYYVENSEQFISKTENIDSSEFLLPFIEHLKPKCRVFDIGCGTGRDLFWLKEQGFNIMGLEKSLKLAKFAEKKLKTKIINADFERYDFSKYSVEGILLVASLVHISHKKLNDVLKGILQAASPSAIVYISLKEGVGVRKGDDGRVFYYWQHDDLKDLFKTLGLKILEFDKWDSGVNAEDVFLSYVLKYAL